jgi:phosphoglucomutase
MKHDNGILAKARYWATNAAFDEQTRKEVGSLLQENSLAELNERFYRNLSFGTGGMRGIMGAGTFRINRYNIQKATSAFLCYLTEAFPEVCELRVAISYDSRHNSRTFALAAAEVIASRGGKVFVTAEMRPVPFLSFLVRDYACHGGICITASHNPPSYNGFKVYLSYGGQLVPPHDQAVVAHYNRLENFTPEISCSFAEGLRLGRVEEVGAEMDKRYLAEVCKLSLYAGGRDDLTIVYSPLHGTGGFLVPQALRAFGFSKIFIPPEQAEPDGAFPTVSSPNPEDPHAFTIALALARKVGGDVVLATDPDSDRIGVSIREADGEYHFLNGNQLSCLLHEYLLAGLSAQQGLPRESLIIKTIVTTDLLVKIAEHYGVHWEETLTGFKWIAARIEAYEQGEILPYRRFICGGEESYGFLAGNFVRDKDAVLACALTAEMTAYYRSHGRNLLQCLDDIFTRCGVYWEALHSIDLPGRAGAQQTAALMQRLSTNPPRRIAGSEVLQVVDYQRGLSSRWHGESLQQVGRTELPAEPMLQFFLSDGSKLSIRPSGTEPKVKIYLAAKDARRGLQGAALAASKQQLQGRLAELAAALPELLEL